jgi:hypothetical protein
VIDKNPSFSPLTVQRMAGHKPEPFLGCTCLRFNDEAVKTVAVRIAPGCRVDVLPSTRIAPSHAGNAFSGTGGASGLRRA